MKANVKSFWVDSLIGGNIITAEYAEFLDFYTPVSLDNVFSFSEFSQTQKTDAVFAPRLRVQALIEGSQSLPVIVSGIDKTVECELGNHVVIDEGRWFEDGKKEIMLSYATASTIGAQLGDSVSFTVMTSDGYPSYELLTLVGYLSFGNVGALFGDNIAYVPLSVLQELCTVPSDDINEVATNIDNPLLIHGKYAFHNGENMISLSKLISTAIIILEILIFAFFGCFLFFSIITSITAIIKGKDKEISVYLTFGAEPYHIRLKIMSELFMYCLFCVLIGSVSCVLLIKGFNALGFYSIDIATEMLMSSNRFTIAVVPGVFLLCFAIIIALMSVGSVKAVLDKTSAVSLKSIEKDD